MAESVTALRFAYFDSANNPVPNPPPSTYNLDAQGLGGAPNFASVTERSAVRRIVITVIELIESQLPGTGAAGAPAATSARLKTAFAPICAGTAASICSLR